MHTPEICYQVHYSLNGEYWEIETEFFYSKEDASVAFDDILYKGMEARVWQIEDNRTISDITEDFIDEDTPKTDREEHSLTASQLGVGVFT